MTYLLLFLAGALLCNAIPHLAAGLRGEPFPTPFAKPRGVGLSPPLVNFLWGLLNLVVGLWLAAERPFALGVNVARPAGRGAWHRHLPVAAFRQGAARP